MARGEMMNILLLIVSLLVLFFIGIYGFLYTLILTLITFLWGKWLQKKPKKILLVFALSFPILGLLFFKIIVPFTNNLFIPLGVSYFSLQMISFLVDSYKGKIENSKLFDYVLYICFVPCLFMGPINRYQNFVSEIHKENHFSKDNIMEGFFRISIGLFKKFIIAGRVSILIHTITSQNLEGFYVILACFLYSILLFADFSGAIDIVLGVSKCLGIDLKENFNSPFLSFSVKEFWNRWHITLGSWLKDYIYIPLGGNRCGKFRNKVNILLTFLVSGIWHGVEFIYWGLLQGFFVAFFRPTKHKWIGRIITFILISFSWIFFVYQDSSIAFVKLTTIFHHANINMFSLGLNLPNLIFLLLSIIVMSFYDWKKDCFFLKFENSSSTSKIIYFGSITIVLLLFGIYGIGFEINDFIYSKF